MIAIFGEDLLNKETMIPYFDQLTGLTPYKPFECVGTVEEVNEALRLISSNSLQVVDHELQVTNDKLQTLSPKRLLLERYQKLKQVK